MERSWNLEQFCRWTISYWKHPLKEVHVKGTLLVDASSRAAVIRIWRTAPRQELLGNVSASEARQMLHESWFKFYGRPETVMTDPEGCFRERLFREWLASKNVKWDPQPAEAAWRIGILDKVLDVLKNAATRAARRAPEDTSCEALFDDCTEAHNELHRRRGYSPFQLLIGRSPPGLPLDGDKQLGEVSASLTSDGRHRLHIQRECYRAYLDEEMSLQQKRREMHKSRPFRVWSSGEWCWFWRSRAHLHRRTKASRQFKEGAFLGPARVLLQERERKGDDLKYKAVVWIVGWRPAGTLFLNSSSSGVDSGTNTVFAERWGGSDLSTSGARTSKAKFRGSCWTAITS